MEETKKTNINKKMLITFIEFWICSITYFIIKVIPKHNLQGDIKSNNPIIFYDIVMALCLVVSIFGIVFIIINKINPNKIKEKLKTTLANIFDWFIILPICVCLAAIIFNFIFTFCNVVGDSMVPYLDNGENLVLFYDTNLERDDIVVIDVQKDKYFNVNNDKFYVKRVIGLPGDSIRFEKIGNEIKIYINNNLYLENYYQDESYKLFNLENYRNTDLEGIKLDYDNKIIFKYKENNETIKTYVIPEGYFFVMGDNRAFSKDSRTIGLIHQEDVVGTIKYRLGATIFNWRRL